MISAMTNTIAAHITTKSKFCSKNVYFSASGSVTTGGFGPPGLGPFESLGSGLFGSGLFGSDLFGSGLFGSGLFGSGLFVSGLFEPASIVSVSLSFCSYRTSATRAVGAVKEQY